MSEQHKESILLAADLNPVLNPQVEQDMRGTIPEDLLIQLSLLIKNYGRDSVDNARKLLEDLQIREKEKTTQTT